MYFCKLFKKELCLEHTTCGQLNISNLGETVTLCGWVQKSRDLGGTTFIDVRDRYGLTQLVLNTLNLSPFASKMYFCKLFKKELCLEHIPAGN
jgi:aspartyl-tRNA synthetase